MHFGIKADMFCVYSNRNVKALKSNIRKCKKIPLSVGDRVHVVARRNRVGDYVYGCYGIICNVFTSSDDAKRSSVVPSITKLLQVLRVAVRTVRVRYIKTGLSIHSCIRLLELYFIILNDEIASFTFWCLYNIKEFGVSVFGTIQYDTSATHH